MFGVCVKHPGYSVMKSHFCMTDHLVSIDPSGRGAFEKPGGKGRDPGAGRTEITVI